MKKISRKGEFLNLSNKRGGISMLIKIYTIPTCKWCKLLKEHLDSYNVSYEDVDVSKDRFSAIEMIKKSGQSAVPVIEIENNIIIGFDKEQIDKQLTEQLIYEF